MAGDVALALQEAVNCSSIARQTPLHAAAEAGNAVMVKVRAAFTHIAVTWTEDLVELWLGLFKASMDIKYWSTKCILTWGSGVIELGSSCGSARP